MPVPPVINDAMSTSQAISPDSCCSRTPVSSSKEADSTAAEKASSAGASLNSIRRKRSNKSTMTLTASRFPLFASIVKSKKFEILIGIVIVINCATMGLEAEILLGKASEFNAVVQVSEHLITMIFLAELVMRVLVFGWREFLPVPGSLWNFLDAVLVLITGVFVVWLLPLFGVKGGSTLRPLTVLRALRLARLVRVVQKFDVFHEVWLLLRGLMESGRVLFWTVVVIFSITYIFAVFGVALLSVPLQEEHQQALAAGDAGQAAELEELVDITGGVTPLMFTLIQVLTLDSWNSIARPMMRYLGWSWIFFYLYIAIAVIVMMNLVTAVIVENALKNSRKDAIAQSKEKKKKAQMQLDKYQQVFEDLDVDGDGVLTWLEFASAFEDKELAVQMRLLGIEPENAEEIFNMLDTGDGVLSVQEFFEGIVCMEGSAQAKDLLRTNRKVDSIEKLILQTNHELREDLNQMIRLFTGAACTSCNTSPKTKARISLESDDPGILFSSRERSPLPSSPSAFVRKRSGSGLGDRTALGEVMGKLEQVMQLMNDCKKEYQQSSAECSIGIEGSTRQIQEYPRQCQTHSHAEYAVQPGCPSTPVHPLHVSLDEDRTAALPLSQWAQAKGRDGDRRYVPLTPRMRRLAPSEHDLMLQNASHSCPAEPISLS